MVMTNLYKIEFTVAGPIIIKEMDIEQAAKDKEEYIKKELESFTFSEANDIVVKWFKDRANLISLMDEKTYFDKEILTNEEFNKFIQDAT